MALSFKLAARYLVFTLLLACGPGTPPPAALPEKDKAPAPVVRPSCSAMHAETSLDASIYSGIGRTYIAQLYGLAFSPAPPHPIRGASWLYGLPREESDAALYHLTSRGEIASLPLPIFPQAAVLEPPGHVHLS